MSCFIWSLNTGLTIQYESKGITIHICIGRISSPCVSIFQKLREQLEVKRPLVEQTLEAGRLYLQEEGEDNRLSSDSVDSRDQGKSYFPCLS